MQPKKLYFDRGREGSVLPILLAEQKTKILKRYINETVYNNFQRLTDRSIPRQEPPSCTQVEI